MGRILALDYGQKRVGVAVTDELQLIAGPLDTVHTKDLMSFLTDYLRREKVDCIVVGEPRQMNGSPSESAIYINSFLKQLKKTFPALKVETVDERFTSKIASRAILDSGVRKKDRQDKSLVDKVSAVLILQSYLESRTWAKNP
jgi:putative Holliday junction resolvase